LIFEAMILFTIKTFTMKRTFIALFGVILTCMAFTKAPVKKATSAYVSFSASEYSPTCSFRVFAGISEPVCEDVTINGKFRYDGTGTFREFTVVIPAGLTSAIGDAGAAPPGSSTESEQITGASPGNACGIDILY
jgi:hypothetical protein